MHRTFATLHKKINKKWGEDQNIYICHGRLTDVQKAHKKIFNISNHQGVQIKNTIKILFQVFQNYSCQNRKKIKSAVEDVEKRETWCTFSGNVYWCSQPL